MNRAISIVFLLACTNAEAQDPAAAFGAGAGTCAQFAKSYQISPDEIMPLFYSWAQGFMTAANIAKQAMKLPLRNLKGMSQADQEDSIRYFCNRRPLALFGDAVIDLYNKLPEIPSQ